MNPISDFCGEWTFMPLAVLRDRHLTPAAKLVYCAVAEHIRLPGRPQSWPSEKTLADTCSLSVRAVRYGLRQLNGYLSDPKEKDKEKQEIRDGTVYLEIEARNRDDGGATSNRYVLSALVAGGHAENAPPPPAGIAGHEVVVDEEVNTPADKPREESSDNPTTTEAPRERVIVPAEETVPYHPLARPKKPPDPKYHAIGARARRLWAQIVVPAAPPLATWSPATLVKAGKTVAGLKDTPFAGKTLEELMPILVARIKSCNPFVRKSVNFGWLFCSDAPNLARMLAGDWDTGAGEVEEPKRRAIPADDFWPGMDEAAYWRKKDKGE